MTLDVAIIDGFGRPGASVQVQVGPHVRLMALVDELQLPLLQRLEDYYKDADFAGSELGRLLDEVRTALELASGDAELVEFLSGLQSLVGTAIEAGLDLAVIAD